MNLSSSARCLLGLLALQLASACGSTPPPTNTGDTTAPTSRASPAGGSYSGSVTVSLLCDDGGGSGCAGTYYTLDGTEPTRSSPAFKDAIALTTSTTLKYFSVDKAGNAEAVHTEQYTFGGSTGGDTLAPTTTATPAGGFYPAPPTVTLACDDAGGSGCAATYYTLDGSAPTRSSTQYTAPLPLTGASVTLRFFSVDKSGNQETVKTQTYTVDTVAPSTVATPAGGAFNSARAVTLACTDTDGSGCAATYYTVDGTVPTTASTRYTSPIPVTATTTLRFFSVDRADNQEAPHSERYVLDVTPPTVAASPKGGTYGSPVAVTLTCDDGNGTGCAAIHYTLDGSAPTAASPLYTPPLTVSASATLRFFAQDAAGNASAAGSETYLIDTAGPATTATPAGGTYAITFSVTLACNDGAGGSGCAATYFTTDGSSPTVSSQRYASPIPVTATTTLKFFSVDNAGHEGARGTEQYTLDFDAPVTVASPKGGNYAGAQSVTLSCTDGAGTGCKATYYTLDGSTPTTASLSYTGTPIAINASAVLKFFSVDAAGNRETVHAESYFLDTSGPVTTASPAGGSYNTPQNVKLTCADGTGSGCSATHYTTDGSTPTTTSPRYTAPIPISANTTLKFFSLDAANNAEPVKTETYLIDTVAPTTTATPGAGTYGTTQNVTLACADGSGTGCKATYYTTDGSAPTQSSSQYTGSPIAVTADTVLRFFSTDNAGNSEPVQVLSYVIDTLPPTTTATPAGKAYNSAQDVTLSCVDAGGAGCKATYYTADGSTPTTASTRYNAGDVIHVTASGTLKFFSVDAVSNTEPVRTENYVIDTVAPLVSANPVGGNFRTAPSVTLRCDDGSGTGCSGPIYFTTDGSTPTTSSSTYAAPIAVSATTTLKFFSKDAVGNSSGVKTETYVIDTVAPTASASPAGGVYNTNPSVTLSCADTGGSGCKAVHYTLDGSNPTLASPTATSVNITGTQTLKFLAEDNAGNTSGVYTESYELDTTPPTVAASPAGRMTNSALSVTLTCADGARACKEIRYTTDGSTPTTGSAKYTSALSITATTTLKFFGVDLAGNNSAVASETYTFDTVAPVTTASPAGGNYPGPTTVTLSCSDALAGCQDTYYTTDGSTPTLASARYTGAFTVGSTTTLKFFSTDKAGNQETVRTEVYTLPVNGADISAQIAAVRAAVDGPLTQAIDKALVTYVKPGVGNLTNDPAGFFLQGEKQGPALFVVDPGTLSPAPKVGDRVSLVVTQKGTSNGQPRATAFSNYARNSQGEAVGAFVQDVSNVDVPANLEAYDTELLTLSGTIVNTFIAAGTGHSQAAMTTVGVPLGSASASLYRLRIVDTVLDQVDLANGCNFTLTAPLWRFNTTAQPSAWATQDVQVLSCPAPKVTSALALSPTSLAVRFDRRISAASVLANASQFTFDNGLTATSATVVDREVRLTTSAQASGVSYTVTVAGSVKDTLGSALDATATIATFTGYQQPAILRINEVAPNIASGRDLVELYVVQGGNTYNAALYQEGTATALATLPSVSVATGDIIVVHLTPDRTTGPILDAPVSETTSKSQYPAVSYSANYDTAWDFQGGNVGITLGNIVLRVKDAVGNTQDAVAFTRTGNTNGSFPSQLQAIQAEGLWLPSSCGGTLCTYTSTPTAYAVSVDWSSLVTSATGRTGPTLYRIGNSDSDQYTDWTTGTGNSLGLSN